MHDGEFRYSFVPTSIQFGKVYDKSVEKKKKENFCSAAFYFAYVYQCKQC